MHLTATQNCIAKKLVAMYIKLRSPPTPPDMALATDYKKCFLIVIIQSVVQISDCEVSLRVATGKLPLESNSTNDINMHIHIHNNNNITILN